MFEVRTLRPAINTTCDSNGNALVRILLVGSAVVLFWRGAWGLMDLYIFPDNPLLSYLVSRIAGLGILYATRMLSDKIL